MIILHLIFGPSYFHTGPYLQNPGINAVEVMPIMESPGPGLKILSAPPYMEARQILPDFFFCSFLEVNQLLLKTNFMSAHIAVRRHVSCDYPLS